MTEGGLQGRRCVVAGGAGAVGGLMVDLLLGAGADVVAVDVVAPAQAAPACEYVRGDIRAMDARLIAEVERAGVVVLAVPEDVALAAVPALARRLRPAALIVDTLSVKTGIDAALAEHAAHLEALSLNPMFAPDLGLEGRAVAAVVVRGGPRARALLEEVVRRGGRVVEVGADEHDTIAAVTQALTHAAVLAFGVALEELGVGIDELAPLATPPHATLLALLARVSSGKPQTYWHVQADNPHAQRARAALAAGVTTICDAVDRGAAGDFAAALERARTALGPDRDAYAQLCRELFAVDGHVLSSATSAKG